MDAPLYASVVFALPLDQPLTYAVPPALRDRAAPGMRVAAPVRNRLETGYIVALSQECDCDARRVRELVDLPDETPLFALDMLELCRWISEYYCCSWGEALHSAVPAGISARARVRYRLVPEQLTGGRFTERQRRILGELHRRGPMTLQQLAAAIEAKGLQASLNTLVQRSMVRAEPLAARPAVSIKMETYVRLREDRIPQQAELAVMQRRAPKQAAVYLDLLYGEPERAATALYARHRANRAVIRALEEKGCVECAERELYRGPGSHADYGTAAPFELNPEQQAAHDAIVSAMAARRFQAFLLKGVTGSGKTEVYLQVIQAALDQGRAAIVLVPEISLTPQTVGRFEARFAEGVAVLHSGLGAGERYDEWRRAKRGEVRIVVGARSAVFAPLDNLGVIIVDEEHDASYKQGETPRYHARDVALVRARTNGAVCVLGSATPSVESYHNAHRGKYSLLELNQRATRARLPEIELVDMREVVREQGVNAVLSPRLESEVNARMAAGEQVILLLNRRGFAPFVLCPQCGWVSTCGDCQVSMTYHAKGGYVSCHYCNARRGVPHACGECDFSPLLFLGTGTQKAEDYLGRAFPNARIGRMDADTTAGKGGHARILGRFARGELDLLIGTQMLAKGHDYPGVTLVGVINADTGLSLPDFRAAEGAYQLMTQVAGRAGRGNLPGKVIIQTFRPWHYAVQAAANHAYEAFFEREIEERRAAGYPPFRRLANLMVEAEDPLAAERAVMRLHRAVAEQIEALDFTGVQTLGPAPATIRRVKKKYRWNLGLLSRSAKRLNAIIRGARRALDESGGLGQVQVKVDFDPYGMF